VTTLNWKISHYPTKIQQIIFDSVNQEVVLVNQGHFAVAAVDTVAFDKTGKMSVKFTRGLAKQMDNPLVHVVYAKPFATFDVSFYGNHLDVDWSMKCDDVPRTNGYVKLMVIMTNSELDYLVGFQVSLWLKECQLIQ